MPTMKNIVFSLAAILCFLISLAHAQAPANEHNCPGTTAIPPFVGSGTKGFSPNQNLCLPQLAPAPTGLIPLVFIVAGGEPGDRVDAQGSIYVVSIRGVPGGIDLWRWYSPADGGPNKDKTLPFRYEGQPDNCGIFSFKNGGCANNTGSPGNLGLAPGAGDADIAINFADDHLASRLCTQQNPGHCASNDPAAFRVATPYFTYELKATKGIVSTGSCAGS